MQDNCGRKSSFELILLKDKLLNDDQTLLLKETGINLSENEARVFAYACRNFRITLTDVRAVTGKMWHECRGITDNLIKLGLIDKVADSIFEPSKNLVDSGTVGRIKAALCEAERAAGEGTGNLSEEDKAGTKTKTGTETGKTTNTDDSEAKIPEKLTDTEYKVLIACKTPRTTKELNEITDIKSRSYLREKIIVPLIESGLLKKTIPDKSKSPDQKYVTTKEGLNYLMTDN